MLSLGIPRKYVQVMPNPVYKIKARKIESSMILTILSTESL